MGGPVGQALPGRVDLVRSQTILTPISFACAPTFYQIRKQTRKKGKESNRERGVPKRNSVKAKRVPTDRETDLGVYKKQASGSKGVDLISMFKRGWRRRKTLSKKKEKIGWSKGRNFLPQEQQLEEHGSFQ